MLLVSLDTPNFKKFHKDKTNEKKNKDSGQIKQFFKNLNLKVNPMSFCKIIHNICES